MRYRSRPVSVAVDPISLVISECISITSAIQKNARSPHSSVSAILGGSPNPIQLGPYSHASKGRNRSSLAAPGADDSGSDAIAANNRWGLRGQKGKSMQDNPMIAGFGKLRYEIAAIQGASCPPPSAGYPMPSLLRAHHRRPFIRRSVTLGPISACHTGQRNCRVHHHPRSRSIEEVSRIRIRLRRIASFCLGHAVTLGRRDALSIRHQRHCSRRGCPAHDPQPHGGHDVRSGRRHTER